MNATTTPRTCAFDGCDLPRHGRFPHCKAHYMQQRTSGVLKPIQPWSRRLPFSERFWQKVDSSKPSDQCWPWLAATNEQTGYGFVNRNGRPVHAHRVAYELAVGQIPDGMHVDHVCHNRKCVNPAHLRPATPKQNTENHSGPQSNGSSGYRGVSWNKNRQAWIARVTHRGKEYGCGAFQTREEAADAARAKRNELFTHNDLDRIGA